MWITLTFRSELGCINNYPFDLLTAPSCPHTGCCSERETIAARVLINILLTVFLKVFWYNFQDLHYRDLQEPKYAPTPHPESGGKRLAERVWNLVFTKRGGWVNVSTGTLLNASFAAPSPGCKSRELVALSRCQSSRQCSHVASGGLEPLLLLN